MRNRQFYWMIVAFFPLVSGCASSLNTMYYLPCEGGDQIYGGVKLDAEIIRASLANEVNEGGHGPLTRAWLITSASVDLPLSAIADTLTLPITIPATMRRKEPVPEYRIGPSPTKDAVSIQD